MNEQQQQQLKKYTGLLLRRRSILLITLYLTLMGGLGFYSIMPKVYTASTLLLYQKQKVNPAKMSPDVDTNTRDIVATLMQQVTSRTNLEQIIRDQDLYTQLREKLPMEDVIEVMRKHIDILPTKGDIFEVSYEGVNPGKVLRVTNALSAKFIEEHLQYREEKASETSQYIKNELALAKKSIDQKEASMRDYKLKYYNEMPQQREINVARLNSLQVKLQGVQDNIQQLERTKIMAQEQFALPDQNNKGPLNLDQGDMDATQKLAYLQNRLQTLSTLYKQNHPEIKRIHRMIAAIENQLAADDPPPAVASPASLNKEQENDSDPSPKRRQGVFKLQEKNINLTMADLQQETADIKKQIAMFEKWIAAAPVREAEWSGLTRDYDELKRHYDYLVAQNLQAESVENLERKQKGSQFKIMDPARLPEKPSKPNIFKIMALALALGLGLGGGLSFGMELLDTSFRDPAEIEEFLGLSVSCSIPYLSTCGEEKKAKTSLGVELSLILLGLITLFGFAYYLWYRGILIF